LKKATTVLALISAALLAGPRWAAAQGQSAPAGMAFLNVNVGAQPQQREIKTLQNPIMPASGTFSTEYSQVIDLNRLGALVCKTVSRNYRA
jgi:hypothetical protein